MRFIITHLTEYHYDKPVFLQPHTLRLQPRTDAHQSLDSFELKIDPEPAGESSCLGPENELLTNLWFTQPSDHLILKSRAVVLTHSDNPFEYLPTPGITLPLRMPDNHTLQDAAKRPAAARQNDRVAVWAETFANQSGRNIVDFLFRLNTALHAFHRIERDEDGVWPAAKTLEKETGSCRDLTLLFMDACRCQGIPARFVSGYVKDPDPKGTHHLHAWPEVFIPGGGWRGYDPTTGLAVTDRHIALCASSLPSNTSPVVGSYSGTGTQGSFCTNIQICAYPDEAAFD